jgi:hypothetical protein
MSASFRRAMTGENLGSTFVWMLLHGNWFSLSLHSITYLALHCAFLVSPLSASANGFQGFANYWAAWFAPRHGLKVGVMGGRLGSSGMEPW